MSQALGDTKPTNELLHNRFELLANDANQVLSQVPAMLNPVEGAGNQVPVPAPQVAVIAAPNVQAPAPQEATSAANPSAFLA
jgi:hypothetical protein